MILVACPGEPPGDTPSGRPRARELAERFAELAEAGATDVLVGLLSADPKRLMHRITESLLPLIAGD